MRGASCRKVFGFISSRISPTARFTLVLRMILGGERKFNPESGFALKSAPRNDGSTMCCSAFKRSGGKKRKVSGMTVHIIDHCVCNMQRGPA